MARARRFLGLDEIRASARGEGDRCAGSPGVDFEDAEPGKARVRVSCPRCGSTLVLPLELLPGHHSGRDDVSQIFGDVKDAIAFAAKKRFRLRFCHRVW